MQPKGEPDQQGKEQAAGPSNSRPGRWAATKQAETDLGKAVVGCWLGLRLAASWARALHQFGPSFKPKMGLEPNKSSEKYNK